MATTQNAYKESDAVKSWRKKMESHESQKPAAYTSQRQGQIDAAADSILNREAFKYDVNNDALYNMYKDRYVNLGQSAMMDTMGQAAKLTGGYGNSNAQIVGQQAYQTYLQGLTDKIPELAQLAEARYNREGQDMYNRYNLLNQQEQQDYSRWNDDYSRWAADRDYNANMYNTERGYDYGVYRDTTGDKQWQAQFDEDVRRFNFQNGIGEYAAVPSGGDDAGSYVGSSPAPKSGAYQNAEYMVKNSTSVAGQEYIIQHAYETGQITQSEMYRLAGMVGKTDYTKK